MKSFLLIFFCFFSISFFSACKKPENSSFNGKWELANSVPVIKEVGTKYWEFKNNRIYATVKTDSTLDTLGVAYYTVRKKAFDKNTIIIEGFKLKNINLYNGEWTIIKFEKNRLLSLLLTSESPTRYYFNEFIKITE